MQTKYHGNLISACKDKSFKYTRVSPALCTLLGVESENALINKSDFDLPCNAASEAETFIAMDEKVLATGKTFNILECNQYSNNESHVLLTQKSPIINEKNKISGVFMTSIDLGRSSQTSETLISLILQRNIAIQQNDVTQWLFDARNVTPLSKSELYCLLYFSAGLSAKEIAQRKNVSYRTIQKHIENVKRKLGVNTKHELTQHLVSLLSHGVIKFHSEIGFY